jgi:hypothetical protein
MEQRFEVRAFSQNSEPWVYHTVACPHECKLDRFKAMRAFVWFIKQHGFRSDCDLEPGRLRDKHLHLSYLAPSNNQLSAQLATQWLNRVYTEYDHYELTRLAGEHPDEVGFANLNKSVPQAELCQWLKKKMHLLHRYRISMEPKLDQPGAVHFTNIKLREFTVERSTMDHLELILDKVYSRLLTQGIKFPPLLVQRGYSHSLYDGYHRYWAAYELGIEELPALIINSSALLP